MIFIFGGEGGGGEDEDNRREEKRMVKLDFIFFSFKNALFGRIFKKINAFTLTLSYLYITILTCFHFIWSNIKPKYVQNCPQGFRCRFDLYVID